MLSHFGKLILLDALSVVTFVGQGNTTPAFVAVPDQVANAGVTLLITNSATDVDVPAQTLTFVAVSPLPDNATIAPATGVFSWRPLVSQANTTNVIQIKVTDNGQPNLSATNNFKVVVSPVSVPMVSSIAANGSAIQLTVNGPSGPDYTLLRSTNLIDWEPVATLTSPPSPVTLVDTNYPAGPAQYYRVQLGP